MGYAPTRQERKKFIFYCDIYEISAGIESGDETNPAIWRGLPQIMRGKRCTASLDARQAGS
jgi:hypothetical protein